MKHVLDKRDAPLGVYVHLPYCLTKCPYCDFNSYGTDGNFPEADYLRAVAGEIDGYREFLEGREVSTVFFGGGTPSLFSPESIGTVMEKLAGAARLAEGAEVTLEVNPRTADGEKLRSLLRLGVNRISVGAQSFSGRKLDFYGRFATPEDGKRALRDVMEAGFSNFSLDLIYGSPGETREEFERDLETAVGFAPAHVSAYCLAIEPGTEFWRLERLGKLVLPDDSVLARFMISAREILGGAGYANYEISNFAKPGGECAHNLIYWNCRDYLGLGAGAHSHVRGEGRAGWGRRWSNARDPKRYMEKVARSGNAVSRTRDLRLEEALEDMLLMGLRLRRGVSLAEIRERFGLEPDMKRLGFLVSDGFLLADGGRLRITDAGRVFTDDLVARACGAFF